MMMTSLSYREQKSGVLPPWLWFWLAIYILGLPAVVDRFKKNLLILFTGIDSPNLPPLDRQLGRPYTVVELLLDLTLTLGVLLVFLPRIRTVFLQRKYGLTEPQFLSPEQTLPETSQTLQAVSQFLRAYAPSVTLTYNANGQVMRDRAFVYPIGYRRTGIALSGRLLTLWNTDQQAAEAILLHEIEHYRHGDMFVIGAGSFLETIIKRWFLLIVIFNLVPLTLGFLIRTITSIQELLAIGADPWSILVYNIQLFFILYIPSMLLEFLVSFFWTTALFTNVVMAIWCAEINADRFVIDTTQSTQVLEKAMAQHAVSTTWWRWLWSGIHHPPPALRRWLAQRSQSTGGLVLLLLLFPAAAFIKLIFLCGWALSFFLTFLYTGTSVGYIVGTLGNDIVYFLEALVPVWLVMAVLMALWPVLTRYWERIFTHTASRPVQASYRAYLSSTGFITVICIVGLVLTLLPQPAEPSDFKPTIPHNTANTANGHFKIGDNVTIGNLWKITVTSVEAHSKNLGMQASAGHEFLVINVSLTNISTQTSTLMTSPQFTLTDLQNVSYHDTLITVPPPPAVAQNGNVPAGATVQGPLTYKEIPMSVSQFTLSFKTDWKNYDPSQVTVWDITVPSNDTATATSVPTPTASANNYPVLQKSYTGTLVNTTDNSNTSANATLSSIEQDQQGGFRGYMTIQLPLAGSGPCTGTVSNNRTIQFTVTPSDGSGYASIVFTGIIYADGSMSGTYILPGTSQQGTWQLKPA
ncbi:MAG: DUF4352 domain-containing protein [Chloroflexi bacterium]|nr:MAG: DUF4352 domain-containing protein [Chloroflexota bacterium]